MTPILSGDKRGVFGNQSLAGRGVTSEGSWAKSRGKWAPIQTMDAHRQGVSCKIRGGVGLYFWSSQEKKGKSHFLVLYS